MIVAWSAFANRWRFLLLFSQLESGPQPLRCDLLTVPRDRSRSCGRWRWLRCGRRASCGRSSSQVWIIAITLRCAACTCCAFRLWFGAWFTIAWTSLLLIAARLLFLFGRFLIRSTARYVRRIVTRFSLWIEKQSCRAREGMRYNT